MREKEREKAKTMSDCRLRPGWVVGPFRRQAETEREVEATFGEERADRLSEEDESEEPMR